MTTKKKKKRTKFTQWIENNKKNKPIKGPATTDVLTWIMQHTWLYNSMGSGAKCIVCVNETHLNTSVEESYLCNNITYLSCWLYIFFFYTGLSPNHGMIYLNFTVILLMKLAKILQY